MIVTCGKQWTFSWKINNK